MPPKIIILPGNGVDDASSTHWYPWARDQFTALGLETILQTMPDWELARKHIWLPYIKNELRADENTIIIGHSSGGVATLRYLETEKLLGAIVIGVNHTDLGDETEKLSGYYDDPWRWDAIRQNAQWIAQFCSQDDPYIPIDQPRFIHEQIASEYHEYTDRGHFGSPEDKAPTFAELIEVVTRKTL